MHRAHSDFLRGAARYVLRRSTDSAISEAIIRLKREGHWPTPTLALDVFAGSGILQVIRYARHCDRLTLWEIDGVRARYARMLFPNASVHVGDSIVALRKGEIPAANVVVIDNPGGGPFGPGYVEHFDVWPLIWRILTPPAVVMVNVTLDASSFNPEQPLFAQWQARRRDAYGQVDPLSMPDVLARYATTVPPPLKVVDAFWFPRSPLIQLAVFVIR